MEQQRSLHAACQAVGLGCSREFNHTEPRFSISIERRDDLDYLRLVLRNDDTFEPEVLDCCRESRGFVLQLSEETVQREPVLDIWLPMTRYHVILVHRSGDAWALARLPDGRRAWTVAEAEAALKRADSAGV